MIKVFIMIFAMVHGHLAYKIVEAPSKDACELARPEILKTIIDQEHPDSVDVKCVEVTLATVS